MEVTGECLVFPGRKGGKWTRWATPGCYCKVCVNKREYRRVVLDKKSRLVKMRKEGHARIGQLVGWKHEIEKEIKFLRHLMATPRHHISRVFDV